MVSAGVRSTPLLAIVATLVSALVAGLLAGCTLTGAFRGDAARGADAASGMDTSGLGLYFDLMIELASGNEVTRVEAFDAAREAADSMPTITNRLRYALALSVPGHRGSDASAAVEELRALLAVGDALLPQERLLATIQLGQAEQLATLDAQGAELAERLDSAVAARDDENADRIRNLQAENAKLQTELEKANQMLDAITRIEESISERETDEN